MKIFPTRDDLAAAELSAGQNCKTNGLDNILDGGNGEYYIQTLIQYGLTPPDPDSPDVTTLNTNVAVKLADSTLPLGAIVMYAGSYSNIPDGWSLCDGIDGRPDLRGQFVKGATSDGDLNTTGGDASITMPTDTGSTTLTSAQSGLPAHEHGDGLLADSTSGSGFFSGSLDGGSNSVWHGTSDDNSTQNAASGHSHTFTYNGFGANQPQFWILAYIIRTGEIKQVLSSIPPEGAKYYIDVNGSVNLDAGFGQFTIFIVKPDANITSLSIINIPTGADIAYGASIKIISDGSSSVTWGGQFNWSANVEPTLVSNLDEWDWISCLTEDAGLTLDATLSISELD